MEDDRLLMEREHAIKLLALFCCVRDRFRVPADDSPEGKLIALHEELGCYRDLCEMADEFLDHN